MHFFCIVILPQDSIESLFAGITDNGILRLEIKRLFRWLKEKQVTAIVTGEPGQDSYTHHGMEQYISDCIILLDNRVDEEVSVRRIRVVKYRGSNHGTNEYPFVIDDDGLSVIPITSAGLDQPGVAKKVSTGIASLDKLFKGKGYTKGSTVLASGTAGTGKTSLAAAFAIETCKRGERCLFLSYEDTTFVQNLNIMKPKKIWSNLAVSDLERTTKFYTELGFKPTHILNPLHQKQ